MNLLLWAFISLQFAYVAPKTGDIDATPRKPSILYYTPPIKKREELWGCIYTSDTHQKYCYFNHNLHVTHSIRPWKYPVYVQA